MYFLFWKVKVIKISVDFEIKTAKNYKGLD